MFDLSIIIGALGLLGTLIGAVWGRRSGRKAAEGERARKELEAVRRGSKGASEARAGLRKGLTPEEIVRKNDGDWE